MTNPLHIEQSDREAAAGLVVPHGRWPGFPNDFRSGRADTNELTQAFARARLAERQRTARIAKAFSDGQKQMAEEEGWDEGLKAGFETAVHIAQAILKDTPA